MGCKLISGDASVRSALLYARSMCGGGAPRTCSICRITSSIKRGRWEKSAKLFSYFNSSPAGRFTSYQYEKGPPRSAREDLVHGDEVDFETMPFRVEDLVHPFGSEHLDQIRQGFG